jgi:apolipoprotein D and lipocalin family protein
MNAFSLLAALGVFVFAHLAQAQLKTVPYVDPARYIGDWYQIAYNPLPFESGCVCSRQQLGLRPDGLLSVYNSCNDKTPQGPLREIWGTAEDVDPATHSKFLVDFGFPRKGDYWIIGLDTNYQYAVVTDPAGRSLYILSKTPTLSVEQYNEAVTSAAEQVDTTKLQQTLQQGCTYPAAAPLGNAFELLNVVLPPTDPAHPGSPVYEAASGVSQKDLKCGDREVSVFLPTKASKPTGTLPAVVFGHGQALGLEHYQATFEHLAKKGVAVIYPTYDTGFFDQDWQRMGRDYLSLTDCAIKATNNVIAPNQLVFSGHSKGAYIASIAAGLAPGANAALTPKSLVIFETAGFDASTAKSVASSTDVTLVFSDRDTVVKKSLTDSFYAAAKSQRKQIISLKSYPQGAAKAGITADHFWPMTKSSFAGGGPVGPLHYYGSWKWLTAAALDLEPYVFGNQSTDKGLPGLTDDVKRN